MRIDETDAGASRLARPYRPMRRVAPPESPWPGMLVRRPDGSQAVVVDTDLLGQHWAGWEAAASDHLLAPLDVVRRPGGHDALLPVCTERLDAFVRRRTASDAPLSHGEAVTVAVSLVRGIAALGQRGEGADGLGEWWLTDDGRPILAPGIGDRAQRATSAILQMLRSQLRDRTPLADAMEEALDLVADPVRLMRDLPGCEDSLFAAGSAEELVTSALDPRRARTVARVGEPVDPAAHRSRWTQMLAAHVDADVADLASLATSSLRRRSRTRAESRPRPTGSAPVRKKPWLLAGTMASAIVAAGLMWPSGGGGDSPAAANTSEQMSAGLSGAPGPSTPAAAPAELHADPPAAAEQPATGAPASGTGEPDWTAMLAELLAVRTACADDTACLAEVVEDPRRRFPPGVVDAPSAARTITLLDAFGGAAVLRIDPLDGSGRSQLAIVVQSGERRLLRDIHDVAEQTR